MLKKEGSVFFDMRKKRHEMQLDELNAAMPCKSRSGEIRRRAGSKNKNRFLCDGCGSSQPAENPRSHNVASEDLKENSLENKKKVKNFNLSECSGILDHESGENIDIAENHQSEFKTSMDKGPRLKSGHGEFRLGLLDEIAINMKNTKKELEILNSCIESFKTTNKGNSDFSMEDNCFLTPEASEDESPSDQIKSETGFLDKKPFSFLKNYFWSASTSNPEGIDCSKKKTGSKTRSSSYIEVLFIYVLCLMVPLIKLNRTSNLNPGMPIDQFTSFLLIDGFEDKQWANDGRMYFIASIYSMHELRNRMSSRLQSGITVSNAWITYVVADVHEDQKLKESAELFLKTYANETLHSESWKAEVQSLMTTVVEKYIADYESSNFSY